MADYDTFATDYAWLLDDDQRTGEPFLSAYEHELAALPPGATVLDASCGIGVEAVALARRGFEVTATDASAAMVSATAALATSAGLRLRSQRARWEDLATTGLGPFALVLCTGNSLVHAGPSGLVDALTGLAAVLEPGGRIVVGTRDFEHLRRTRPDVEVAPRAVRRDGTTALCTYAWTIPDAWEAEHVASVHLALVDDTTGVVTHRRHDVAFVPFRAEELDAAIVAAGLEVERSDRSGATSRCTLVLRHRRADADARTIAP